MNFENLKELKIIRMNVDVDALNSILSHGKLTRLELDIVIITKNPRLLSKLSQFINWKRITFRNGPNRSAGCRTAVKILASSSSE